MKNIYLIGDSIRMGYGKYVKENLKDIANVYYPIENCESTQNTMISLCVKWLNDIPFKKEDIDVVHWNNGHWDIRHWDDKPLNSINNYCDMLKRIYHQLTNIFPNAKIIFATTTPMNPLIAEGEIRTRTTDEIIEYNIAAKEALKDFDIEINDLFEVMKNFDNSVYADYCHYTEEGYEILADHVSKTIKKLL